MSARQPGPYAVVARKWLALVERRQAHLVELRETGRWKHYFSEAEIDTQLRELTVVRHRWAKIAGVDVQLPAAVA